MSVAVLATLPLAHPAWAKTEPRLPPQYIIARIYAAIAKHHLTSLRKNCFVLAASDPEKAHEFMLDAREVHSKTCGGDPETDGLRMFSIRVLPSGVLLTDALSVDRSEYLPLK